MPPDVCPHCGAEVPSGAKACPECGSDERTGWSEEAQTAGLDLPDEHFDYKEFVKQEFGGRSPVPSGMKWWWWLAAILVLAAFLLLWLR